MRIKFISLTIFFSFALGNLFAQNEHKLQKEVKKTIKHENYKAALPLLLEMYASDSLDLDVNYNLALCYFNTGQNSKSLTYFEFVKKNRSQGKYPNTEFYLGKAYHSLNAFAKALLEYQSFMTQLTSDEKYDKELLGEIKKNIRNCEVGSSLIRTPVKCIIKNLGDKVNTSGNECYPLVSANGKYLYFAARNEEHESFHDNTKHHPHSPLDIFSVEDVNGAFTRPYVFSLKLHTDYADEPVAISKDGSMLYFLSVTKNNSTDIYSSEFINQDWTAPKLLDSPFNSEGTETGFTISTDGKTAFLSSDRQGGAGGQDLYIVEKDEKGNWQAAINLGTTINSPYNEEEPFLSADGETLFFSSNGMNSMGGYDLFKIQKTDSGWSQPENLGYPINTAGDETHVTLYANNNKGFFNANREDSKGGSDLYFLQIIDTSISPAKYITNYLEDVLFEEALVKPDTGEKLKDVVYFDFNASKIANFSEKILNKVVLLMNSFPDLKFEIQGYTDNKGSAAVNKRVSERRANAVYNYLLDKGVGAERLIPVGFGADFPVTKGSTEIELARNRRVEFYVLPPSFKVTINEHFGKYYLVKGSFSSKVNAEKFQDKLNKEHLPTFILSPSSHNKFYRVYLAETKDYEEASKLLKEIKEKQPDVWVLSL